MTEGAAVIGRKDGPEVLRLKKLVDLYVDRHYGPDETFGGGWTGGIACALVERVRWTWGLYVSGSCLCDMGWGSACRCSANTTAGGWLAEVLGSDWHKVCREAYPNG